MTTIAIVCGYDLHSDLQEYVRNVVPVIEGEQCDAIVLSGGYTSPLHDHSEAEAMTRAVKEHLPDAVVILEERAMTTLDNIVYGSEVAQKMFAARRYVVICDRVHALKVVVLAAIVLRVRFNVRAVRRKVPVTVMMFEPFSIVAEAIAAIVPPLRVPLRRVAMRLKGVEGLAHRSHGQLRE
jgi:vancomycin permeability regulator SanA